MAARSATPGLKRLPKPNGFSTWYWAASQISRRAGEFRPKMVRLWHGQGEPSSDELERIHALAERLSLDLREWFISRRRGPRSRRARRGFIYLVRAGDRVKIGFTGNVTRRLSQLQTFFPDRLGVLLVFAGSILDERELHRRFAAHHIGREWFTYAAPIAAFVDMAGRGTQRGRQNRALSESPASSESQPIGACNV